ncbi:MAG: GNAT family N-acetyltransferase [Polyangiaceae bacterium]|jgi:predicted acetyltransferase|nr:GNAT family N-acetyltransferase [Polyangiaceae bacterium]
MILRPLREEELPAAARSASIAFAVAQEECVKWLEGAGLEHLRALEVEGEAAGFLLRIPMGQFVQGRALPMLGVAGVTVPPERRGRGYARAMMEQAVREMHQDGFVLSSLYPSTTTLYRSVGYELSGALHEHRVPRGEFAGFRADPLEVRALSSADPRVRALHERFAARHNGYLARSGYLWGRIARHRGTTFECLGCFRPDGTLAAYACLAQIQDGDEIVLKVRDFAHDDGQGARALLALFDRFTTVAQAVLLQGAPTLPLLALLPQQRHEARRVEQVMTRVIQVQRAFTERPYPRGLRARVLLSVTDPLLDDNHGDFSLSVDHGEAHVERISPTPSASGAALDVRALAPLLLGWSTATHLAATGQLQASDEDRCTLDALFAAPPPALSDYF